MRYASIFAVIAMILLVGCTSGGGGDDDSLTGYWRGTFDSNDEGGFWYFDESGSDVTARWLYRVYTGTRTADPFTLSGNDGVGMESWSVELSEVGSALSGTYTITSMMGGSSGTLDLVRQTPTGSLTVTGSISGQSVNISTTMAFGRTTVGSNQWYAMFFNKDEYYTLDLRHPSGLSVGGPYTLIGSSFPPGPGEIFLSFSADTSAGMESDACDTGSVTITAADSTLMAGTFQVSSFVSKSGSLTGSFDVPFDIVYP
jgi:hypothetical protein